MQNVDPDNPDLIIKSSTNNSVKSKPNSHPSQHQTPQSQMELDKLNVLKQQELEEKKRQEELEERRRVKLEKRKKEREKRKL